MNRVSLVGLNPVFECVKDGFHQRGAALVSSNPVFECVEGGLRAIRYMQFIEDVPHVRGYRSYGYGQLFRDFTVGETARQALEHIHFAWC